MMTALTIIHVVISLALIVVVLLQHGKQQGLSGAIAGGAETFFGKNKGRTIDAMLKKFTAVVAILFIISSVTFAGVAINTYNKANEALQAESQTAAEGTDAAAGVTMNENGELVDAEGNVQAKLDENGNLVDNEGNVLATAEDLAAAQAEAVEGEAAEGEAAADGAEEPEAPAETTPAE